MEDSELDQILSRGLGTYSAIEPSPGLSTRILARLPQAQHSRWWWFASVPALATLAFFWLVPANLETLTVTLPVPTAPSLRRSPAPKLVALQHVHRVSKRTVAAVRQSGGLTAEERALVELAANHPQEAVAAFQDVPPMPIEPIRIASLEFKPIQIDTMDQ